MALMEKIAKIGPSNAAILDTEKGLIERDEKHVLLLDQELARKIKFVKEGELSTKEGQTTLRLVGDVRPVDTIEVAKIKKRSLIELYPFSGMGLVAEIRRQIPSVNQNRIFEIIKENDLKKNLDYSAFNFRNKQQENNYKKSGIVPSGVPSIYNQAAADFLLKVIRNESEN